MGKRKPDWFTRCGEAPGGNGKCPMNYGHQGECQGNVVPWTHEDAVEAYEKAARAKRFREKLVREANEECMVFMILRGMVAGAVTYDPNEGTPEYQRQAKKAHKIFQKGRVT